MKWLYKFWPYLFIAAVVIIFFYPIFKGNIPFPGDLLIDSNPYKTQSYLGYQPGGYPNKAQGPDVITEIYPWRFFSINQLLQGNIPFWNPHNFSGNPQMADFQTAVFYPLNLFYFILPFNLSWTILIMLQPLLAGFFMFLYLKKGIGLRDFPSVLGGISFGFSSYMVVWMEYGNIGSTLLWLPLLLLLTKQFFNKTSVANFLGISISFSIGILAGYIQGAFYIYVLCFLYYCYLVLDKKESLGNYKKHFIFLSALIFPVILTAFQLLPTLSLFSQSTRGAYSLSQIEKNLAPFFSWITIWFPDFFGNPASRNYWIDGTYIERVMYPGTVILFFAIYSLFQKTKYLEKRFFVFLGIVSLIIATNLPFVKYFYLIPIPLISTTIPTRELSIFIFSLIVLGSMGLNYFLEEKEFKKILPLLYLGLFIFFWVIVIVCAKVYPGLSLNLKIAERNMIIPSVIALFLILALYLKKIKLELSLMLITLLIVFDLFYFFNKITPFAPSGFTYPQTPVISYLKENAGINRYWGYGSAYIPANFSTVDGTYSPEGNDPLHISRYGELLSSSINGKLPVSLPRPDANIAPGYGQADLKKNYFRQRILDLLGIKYVLNKVDSFDSWQNADFTTFPKNEFTLVGKNYPWQIYENINSVPRFFISGNYMIAGNKAEALSLIYNPNVDLGKTIILEEKPGIEMDSNATGLIKMSSYKPNFVGFEVKTSGNSLFFLSDTYFPDWNVYVDQKPGKILLADYAFRAIAVPKGLHLIRFIYNPKTFDYGILISLLGLVLIVIISFYVNIGLKDGRKNDIN